MNGNMTKASVTRDLEAMYAKGMCPRRDSNPQKEQNHLKIRYLSVYFSCKNIDFEFIQVGPQVGVYYPKKAERQRFILLKDYTKPSTYERLS